jgi:large subunit ribosomal protein L25
VEYQAFRKVFKEASTTQVLNLNVDGKKLPVLIHQIDYNPVSDRFDHVDFLQIDMSKKVTATVPVEVVGLSPAIKNFNAIVTIVKQEVEVRCLPMDIPHEITVDVSTLENLGDSIHIKDLKLGSKVEILDDLEDTLVSVNAVEEFVEQVVEVPDELKVEAAAGAEGAEGAAPGAEAKEEEKKEE